MKEINQRSAPAAITQLRAEIEALPMNRGGKRRGIPEELKRRIAEALVPSGLRTADFAAAVSLSVSSVWSWHKRFSGRPKPRQQRGHGDSRGFQKMIVTEDSATAVGGFTIEGPSGIRMTGLGAEDVARLWRALC
jgi:hypothetical protein